MHIRKLVAEFIGTFALIFIGAGALAINQVGLLEVALAHGLVVVGVIYAFGHISGAHINPAVTLGFLIAREIRFSTAVGYWFFQFSGAIFAARMLKGLLPEYGDLGVTILAENVTTTQGLFVEIILTFFLVNAIFTTAVGGKAGNFSGIAIGSTLVFCILMGGPLTRASLNPARTLGPAIFAGAEHAQWGNIWLYFVGPCVGAVLAALFYMGILKDKETCKKLKEKQVSD